VKRLLILLIVLAGGLAAASFAVPSTAASVNGVTISQNSLNSDVAAIDGSTNNLYACYLNAQQVAATQGQSGLPPINGVGQSSTQGPHTTATTAFVATYLDTEIGHELVQQLAAKHHLTVTARDVSQARVGLTAQITSVLQEVAANAPQDACGAGTQAATGATVLASMPASFIKSTVHFDATVSVLEEYFSGVGTSTADLQRYYSAHRANFDSACFTVAEYTSQSDAAAAKAKVTAGTPFGQVAAAVAGGGPQGCDILYGIASQLPSANLYKLALNTVSAPIADGSSYILLEITSRTPTPFATARSEVEGAVQSAGATKTRSTLTASEKSAAVSVDPRYGRWVAPNAQVLTPMSPLVDDVLNAAANSPVTATPAAATPGGTGSPSTGTPSTGTPSTGTPSTGSSG
jgi:hypothetical protein